MKKLFSILAIATLLGACSNNHKTHKGADSCADQNEHVSLSVDSFLLIAGDNVGKEITVKGTVDHVCRHTGKRVKIMSNTTQKYIFGMATEKIDTFKTEIEGSEICLIGIVVETKMDSICAPHCEAKESEMKQKECAKHDGNLDQNHVGDTIACKKGNSVAYTINVTGYKVCGSSNHEGCVHNQKDSTCCGSKNEKESDVDKKTSDAPSKPCCEKK